MDDTTPDPKPPTETPNPGIQREDHVIEIPQVTYRDLAFTDGDLTATVEAGSVHVRVSTIDGDTTIRVPSQHLAAIAELLAHIRDDQ